MRERRAFNSARIDIETLSSCIAVHFVALTCSLQRSLSPVATSTGPEGIDGLTGWKIALLYSGTC